MTPTRDTRAKAAIAQIEPLINVRQKILARHFFSSAIPTDPPPGVASLRVQNVILFAGTDPGVNGRMRQVFRRNRSGLSDAGIVYVDQREIGRLPGAKRWASVKGASGDRAVRFVNSLCSLLASSLKGSDADTMIIAHEAFAGIPGGVSTMGSTPSIASRSIRQVLWCVQAQRLHLVLHDRSPDDRLRSLYARHANQGGQIDFEYPVQLWETSPDRIVDHVDRTGVITRAEIVVDSVSSPSDALVSVAKLHDGLAEQITSFDSRISQPFAKPRSIRASQVLARMNRSGMGRAQEKLCREFIDNELNSLVEGREA